MFPQRIALESWMGFDIWLRLSKNLLKGKGRKGFLGVNRWDPESDSPGDEAKVDLWEIWAFSRKYILLI